MEPSRVMFSDHISVEMEIDRSTAEGVFWVLFLFFLFLRKRKIEQIIHSGIKIKASKVWERICDRKYYISSEVLMPTKRRDCFLSPFLKLILLPWNLKWFRKIIFRTIFLMSLHAELNSVGCKGINSCVHLLCDQ